MTKNIIDIQIERSGFPIAINGVDLWVDDSHENLQKLINIESVIEGKTNELAERMQKIDLPEYKKNEVVSDELKQSLKEVTSIDKGVVKLSYDTMFGDGSFDKLYKVIPDYKALERNFKPILEAVSARILERSEEFRKEREAQFNEVKTETLNKKQQKKK